MITELNTLFPLYLFACWHVMMPGHGKTLLIAVCFSGNARSRLLPLALGYGLSHGLLMSLAALAGLLLTDRLTLWMNQYGLCIKNLYLPLLLVFGIYFMLKAYGIRRTKPGEFENVQRSSAMVSRHPFLTGMGIGLIPCSDVLGLAVISPLLIKTGHNLTAAGITVWLGIVSMVLAIALTLRLLPAERLMHRVPDGLAYVASALICFSVFIWRCWILWHDYLSLSGSF